MKNLIDIPNVCLQKTKSGIKSFCKNLQAGFPLRLSKLTTFLSVFCYINDIICPFILLNLGNNFHFKDKEALI